MYRSRRLTLTRGSTHGPASPSKRCGARPAWSARTRAHAESTLAGSWARISYANTLSGESVAASVARPKVGRYSMNVDGSTTASDSREKVETRVRVAARETRS